MDEPSDIDLDISASTPADLADALGEACADAPEWRRDGILEHQVSTREDLQLCFRNEPKGERPRTAICLAGTERTLTVATVVPIDRGVELTDDQYAAVVAEFYEDVLSPALSELSADAALKHR